MERDQNEVDLTAMIAWAKKDPNIMDGLRFINLENWTMTYFDWEKKKLCEVQFAREEQPEDWVGMEGDLVFSEDSCQR